MSAEPSLLELRAVTLKTATRTLVEALSVDIRSGERWTVLGPNGAGKSTLLAAIAGARPVEAGEISLRGRPVRTWPAHELARARALLADRWIDPFSHTVIDTVLTARYVFRDETGAEGHARGWLQRFDCIELADRDVRQLSRGERQRVAIATALAQDTSLVLLDEPTAHQDPRHQALVVQQLTSLADRALIACLHDLNAAARFAIIARSH